MALRRVPVLWLYGEYPYCACTACSPTVLVLQILVLNLCPSVSSFIFCSFSPFILLLVVLSLVRWFVRPYVRSFVRFLVRSIVPWCGRSSASSYIVGGTKAFFKMLSYPTQLYIYFPFDGNHFIESICFYFI